VDLILVGVAAGAAGFLVAAFREPTPGPREAQGDRATRTPHEVKVMQLRTQAKHDLARRVIAERTALLVAAEEFYTANGDEGMLNLLRTVPGRSVREKLCRQVIAYVRASECEMEREGHRWTDPRPSASLQRELDELLAAGKLPPEPGMK
jgi:hypothetical protein